MPNFPYPSSFPLLSNSESYNADLTFESADEDLKKKAIQQCISVLLIMYRVVVAFKAARYASIQIKTIEHHFLVVLVTFFESKNLQIFSRNITRKGSKTPFHASLVNTRSSTLRK